MEWEFNSYYTLIAATLVLLVGKFLVQKIKFLRDFNIPEPVAGGLIAAIVLFALHEAYGVSFKFEKPLQDAFMLIFFTSIGLSADFSRLKAGGLPLVIFTAVVGAFIIVQNFVGVGLASALGLDPLIGLITGSITLTGGHGTAGAWGPDFESKFGLTGATGLGMASATFGLVFGGLIGGPVARRLINKLGLNLSSKRQIRRQRCCRRHLRTSTAHPPDYCRVCCRNLGYVCRLFGICRNRGWLRQSLLRLA